jgi:RHS repeat-associated protein
MAAQTETYSYDANGHMVNKSEGSKRWRYTWDSENRMSAAWDRKQRVRYHYDALGRRVQRVLGYSKENTKYTYDGLDVVMDDDTNSGITKYQNGLGVDSKLEVTNGGSIKYFLQDHLGSTIATTNSSGAVLEQTAYDSFGNHTNNSPSTRYQYTGREFDSFTGLNYYRARFYDPNLGRFISEDPIGLAGGDINEFGYVRNNPLTFRDPTGLTRCNPLLGALIGANAGGLVGATAGAGIGAVAGALAGALTGGTIGTLAEPGGGTFVGAGLGGSGGGAGGAITGAVSGGVAGAVLGAYAGFRYCNQDETTTKCETKPKTNPPSSPVPVPISPDTGRQCPPCRLVDGTIVSVGAVAYRDDTHVPRGTVQHGINGPHYNLYRCNQNPYNCRCFWQPIGAVAPPKQSSWIPIQPFAN